MYSEAIDSFDEKIAEVTTFAMSDDLDTIVRGHRRLLTDLDTNLPDDITAEEMAFKARKRYGSIVESLENEIKDVQQEMSQLALSCFGPVTLSGESNRRTYDITICASGSKPQGPIQPAVVKSEKI